VLLFDGNPKSLVRIEVGATVTMPDGMNQRTQSWSKNRVRP